MKRIFLLAGEVSGDQLAAWYVRKRYNIETRKSIYLEAIGGDFLKNEGVKLFCRYDKLNVIGLTEILNKIPFFYQLMRTVVDYLRKEKFDELVLVDFPGFNLRLAAMVRYYLPGIRIIYAAPPQLWCWGAWRIKKLKKNSDEIIVLYPFEVAWYKERGVCATYLGSPVLERVASHVSLVSQRKKRIAVTLGSRLTEFKQLLPTCAAVILYFAERYADIEFVIPCAVSFSKDMLATELWHVGLSNYRERIIFVEEEAKKMQLMGECCLALVKPGTVTLELALLKIPSCMLFKTSWLNNFLATILMQVPYRALPNLLVGSELFPEFIQNNCDAVKIIQKMVLMYEWFIEKDQRYDHAVQELDAVWHAMTNHV